MEAGLESYVSSLAIRLQFEFTARLLEIHPLEWEGQSVGNSETASRKFGLSASVLWSAR